MRSSFLTKSIQRLSIGLLFPMVLLFSGLSYVNVSTAQEDSDSGAKERYEQAIARGRELAKTCREISVRFFDSSLADSYQWKEKWPEAKKDIADHKTVIEEAAIEWFMECESPPESLVQVASTVANQLYESGNMEIAYELLKKIKKSYPEKEITLDRRVALAGIKCNQFDTAIEFLNDPEAKEAIEGLKEQVDKNMFYLIPVLSKKWKRETEIRQKEAAADDLPRVKLQCSTGDIIVELFENEAPETVANFINLVESGYYDQSVAHPVINKIVAQAGLYRLSKIEPLGYVIKNESRLPEARSHFAGSLSMVSSEGGVDSATTAFAITLIPNPDLDWDQTEEDKVSQTVFGRVVEGIDRVNAFPATVEIDPETNEKKPIKGIEPGIIQKVTVIRKRNHEYKFEKITLKKD